MAEVIGFIASIATIVEIADKAPKVVKFLYNFASKPGALKEDINIFASEIDSFASLTKHTFSHIKRCATDVPKNVVLHVLRDAGLSKALSLRSKIAMQKIQDFRKALQSLPRTRSLSFWGRVKMSLIWHFWKKDVQYLSVIMRGITADLTHVLNLVQLDILLQSPRTPEQDREIRDLHRQINMHEKTIQFLHTLTITLLRKIPDQSSFAEINKTFIAEDRLINVSQRITAEIPQNRTSSSAQDASQNSSTTSDAMPEVPKHTDEASSDEFQALEQLPVSEPRISSINPQNNIISVMPPINIRLDSHISSRRRPHLYHISFEDEKRVGEINGREATAYVDRKFPANLMTRSCAKSYNLEIKEQNSELNLVTFDFGLSRKVKCIGTVSFTWKNRDRRRWEFHLVRCFICEDVPAVVPPKLIFGQSYLMKEEETQGGVE